MSFRNPGVAFVENGCHEVESAHEVQNPRKKEVEEDGIEIGVPKLLHQYFHELCLVESLAAIVRNQVSEFQEIIIVS